MCEEKLQLEINQNFIQADTIRISHDSAVMITPPLDEAYWLLRVKLYKNQAIIAFPKFGCIGIGFAIEESSWNTNLPYQVEAERIYKHIKINQKYPEIPESKCIEAIKILQETCKKLEEI